MRLQSIGLVALILSASCLGTPPPPDDAGDTQWVMEAIPTLLGRPAKSTLELKALVDIVGVEGRAAVAERLMKRAEFDRYWSLVLLEDMQLDTGGTHAIDTNCLVDRDPFWQGLGADYIYADSFFEGMTDQEANDILSYVGPGLARVKTPGIHHSFGKLVEAAVHNDRLDLAFAAHMPVLASTHTSDNKEALRRRFLDRVINRDLDCVACHNGEWSATDDSLQVQQAQGGWDRSWGQSDIVLEGSLFDYPASGGVANGAHAGGDVATNVNNLFGLDQWGAVVDETFSGTPGVDTIYGLKPECVTRSDGSTKQQLRVDVAPQAYSSFAGMSGNHSVLDVANTFLGDSQQLGSGFFHAVLDATPRNTYDINFPLVVQQQSGWYTGGACIGCHSVNGALDPGFAEIPDWRIEEVLTKDPPPAMENHNCKSAGWPHLCAAEVIRDIRDQVPYRERLEYDKPERALGMAVAMQVADHIAEEISGSRITLDHGLARSLDGADLQRELAYRLVDNGWSLRAVLKHIVLSDGFNRRAPGETQAASPEDHYVLAQVAKPFAQLQPGSSAAPKDNFASLGDSVHRHSAVHLVEKVHHALGWPSSWAPGTTNVYPEPAFLHGLGQFKSGDEPGFNAPILPAQLVWEQQMGACDLNIAAVRSPQTQQWGQNAVSNPGQWQDWIDVLLDDAIAGDWPVEQVLQMTRERLIQDPNFVGSEGWQLEVLANEHQVSLGTAYINFDDPPPLMYPFTSAYVDPTKLETVVRQYCGALLTSPQFMMGGISTADAGQAIVAGSYLPQRPSFQTPGPIRPGAATLEPTTFVDWCDEYGHALDAYGGCTELVTTFGGGGVNGLVEDSDASEFLREVVVDDIQSEMTRATEEAVPALESAVQEIASSPESTSQDGAADRLERGEYTQAMQQLEGAAEDLLVADALGCDCEEALGRLVDGSFLAVEVILRSLEARGANPEGIAEARAILARAEEIYAQQEVVQESSVDTREVTEPEVAETMTVLREAVDAAVTPPESDTISPLRAR